MGDDAGLSKRFEEARPRLRAVAHRMLGSAAEADDAVQEAWLHASRAGATGVDNVAGWLTTIVSRVCLDMLRSRKSRREELVDAHDGATRAHAPGPEDQALVAEGVSVALLVVLDALEPAERLAFVLHDSFDVPFAEIAEIVGRSPDAARQLASRARRRVGGAPASDPKIAEQRSAVSAFLAALRAGDLEGVVAVLDPDVVVRADAALGETRGARKWAKGAVAFARLLGPAEPALVDGAVGVVVARGGRLWRALRFAYADGKIARIEIVMDPKRVAALDVRLL